MKHVSIRVAWHDNKWNGTVCKYPIHNTFCAQLKRIAGAKDCEKEVPLAGKNWKDLSTSDMPTCIAEVGGFMNQKNYKRLFVHVYANRSDYPHRALEPTLDNVSAFSFYGTPFRYMLCENQDWLDEKFPNLPKDKKNPYPSSWIFGAERQRAILEHFREQISSDHSLVVFYTKNGNPVDEECQRLIIGIGEITNIYSIGEYQSKADYTYPFWDIKMSHSIRPDLSESKGFLLPYHEYLALDEDDFVKTGKPKEKCIDEIKLNLKKLGGSPQMLDQLSYGCEHVDNHNMLIILNAARQAIENVIAHKLIGGDWQRQLRWIDNQIAKVKEQMGPFPAFAEALRAAGFNYSYMLEQDLRNQGHCKPKDNPWLLFEDVLSGKLNLGKTAYSHLLKEYRTVWRSTGKLQKEILQLLSRINLNDKQIKSVYDHDQKYYNAIIQNPYILSEDCDTDFLVDTISSEMIDEGFMIDPDIQGIYTPSEPSLVNSLIDERRIRAIIIKRLKDALTEGDTLLSQKEMELYLEEYLVEHDYSSMPKGYIDANKSFISERINYIENKEHEVALQLKEYTIKEEFVSKKFIARSKSKSKIEIKENWVEIVKSIIENFDNSDTRSVEAVKDQARALDVMANYKLSVLTGPAGTGKTKVVEAFLESATIRNQGVLLLAPTGKARVRLAKMAGIQALTIAQFLVHQNCFNPRTMRPYWNDKSKVYSEASTVIIDECSMLTLDDFYYVFKALSLSTVQRIILIGDPYQLPPIGPGRPFADLCTYLEKNKLNSLARLNIVVRTTTKGDSDILTLASWFSGIKPDKAADNIFNKMASGNLNNDLSVYTWQNTDDLRQQLCKVLALDYGVSVDDLPECIEQSLGIGVDQLLETFNNPEVLESFQILSPVKHPLWGTVSINSILQELLGTPSAKKHYITAGAQKIYARDKVIQLINEKREAYDGHRFKEQLSNGQIGFVRGNPRGIANIAFVGYPNITFGYTNQDDEMREPSIELAYAITIHKSQGSDFETVMVVLPRTGRLLSRELIYTALTRSKKRLILFIEEDTNWIKSLSTPDKSVVAIRNSNLLDSYAVREKPDKVPYVEGLIHQTEKGKFVRSKSEVIIANELHHKDLPVRYEESLVFSDNSKCLPDFTFETESGDKIIWEHLGMLKLPDYRKRWEEKLKKYEENGFILGDNLFTTEDKEDGGISTPEILSVIDKIIERIDG